MSKMNWDRARRESALRGAEPTIDPDGTTSYDRRGAQSSASTGSKATSVKRAKKAKRKKRSLLKRRKTHKKAGLKNRSATLQVRSRAAEEFAGCPKCGARRILRDGVVYHDSGSCKLAAFAVDVNHVPVSSRRNRDTELQAKTNAVQEVARAPAAVSTAVASFKCAYCRNTLPEAIREKHLRRCKARRRDSAASKGNRMQPQKGTFADINLVGNPDVEVSDDVMAPGRTLLLGHFESDRRRH